MKGVDKNTQPSEYERILNDDIPLTDITLWRGDSGFFRKYKRGSFHQSEGKKFVGLSKDHEDEEDTLSESSLSSLSSSSPPPSYPLILENSKIVTGVVQIKKKNFKKK